PLAPTAIYLMGYNYFEVKKPDQGEKAYNQVIKNYPESPAARHAQLQLAEYLFEKREWDKAMDLYTKVMEDKSNPTNLLIAKYKHSWCEFHKGHLQDALGEMKSAFYDIKADKKGTNANLLDETTKSVIFLFGQVGAYKEATEFLMKNEEGEKLVDHLLI